MMVTQQTAADVESDERRATSDERNKPRQMQNRVLHLHYNSTGFYIGEFAYNCTEEFRDTMFQSDHDGERIAPEDHQTRCLQPGQG